MQFLDVPPSYWAFNDINDLASINLYGYGKFIESIPYNQFETNYPAIDKMIPIQNTTKEVSLNMNINIGIENPLTVLLNGIEVGYAEIKLDKNNNTVVVLRREAPAGSFVRVICPGKVKMKENSPLNDPETASPGKLPEKYLSFLTDVELKRKYRGYYYIYDPDHLLYSEIATWKGVYLKRIPYYSASDQLPKTGNINSYIYVRSADNESGIFKKWDIETKSWVDEAIPKEDLMYTISPDGLLITPYALNNELINIKYVIGLKDESGNPIKNSYQLLNEVIYPESKKMVYVNRYFPESFVSRSQLIAMMDRLRVHILLEYANYKYYNEIVVTKDSNQSAFEDVRALAGAYKWWWKHLANLEDLKLSSGEYLLNYDENGNPITDGSPRPQNAKIGIEVNGIEYPVSRGEAAWFLNRFRKYFLEILV